MFAFISNSSNRRKPISTLDKIHSVYQKIYNFSDE